jgi:nucleotide-binding universal stress UspA family protein
MRKIERVLVPIGISHDPASSVDAARTVARRFDATVRLLAVVDPKSTKALKEFASVEGVTLEEAGRVHLERLARELTDEGIATEVNVVFSDHTAEAIAHEAVTWADMIVLATHGRNGPGRWILGSVTEGVVRRTDVPVLVVPLDSHQL